MTNILFIENISGNTVIAELLMFVQKCAVSREGTNKTSCIMEINSGVGGIKM